MTFLKKKVVRNIVYCGWGCIFGGLNTSKGSKWTFGLRLFCYIMYCSQELTSMLKYYNYPLNFFLPSHTLFAGLFWYCPSPH